MNTSHDTDSNTNGKTHKDDSQPNFISISFLKITHIIVRVRYIHSKSNILNVGFENHVWISKKSFSADRLCVWTAISYLTPGLEYSTNELQNELQNEPFLMTLSIQSGYSDVGDVI